jgi:predicted ATPase
LEFFRHAWTLARNGGGSLNYLQGEAGIGKSRLVAEIKTEVSAETAPVNIFQCQPRGEFRPLHPFLDSIARELRNTTLNAPPTSDDLREWLLAQGAEITELTANAIEFLLDDISFTGPSDKNLFRDLSDLEIRDLAVQAIVELLLAFCKTKPRLLIIEDFHWADSLTRDVVARLSSQITRVRALVIVTSRDLSFLDSNERTGVVSLTLPRLDSRSVRELVRTVWGSDYPPELPSFIFNKSEGVPLFAEELVLFIRSLPNYPATASYWERALRDGSVVTLQDLIAARLEGLGEARHVAQLASVIGRDFGHDLLEKIIEPHSAERLGPALSQLLSAGIIVSDGTAYRFGHVLFQEAAYNTLLKTYRRELHRRIAQILITKQETYSAEVIAWHYSQAGQALEAAQFGLKAAEACVSRSAMEEAEKLLSFAQEQLDSCDAEASIKRDLRLLMLAVRGPVVAALFGRGSPQACAIYEEGVRLCQSKTNQDLAKWFPLYWGWWFTAPNSETKARSDIIVRDLKHTTDPEVKLQSLHCAWATAFDSGQHTYCLDCVREGLKLYDHERAIWSRARYGGHDAKVCALGERALSSWFLGRESEALNSLDEAVNWAELVDHPASVFHALDYGAGLHYYRNDPKKAAVYAERMKELATIQGMPSALVKAQLFGAWAKAIIYRSADYAGEFDKALQMQREIGTEENICIYSDMKVSLLEISGEIGMAMELTTSIIETSLQTGQVFWIPELYRRRAKLHADLGHSTNCWEYDIRSALDLAESQGAIALVERAQSDLLSALPSG